MASFSWASAADVGLGLLSGYAQGRAAKATADAENAIRDANNSVARSSSMLARTIQNINNQRILKSAGKNVDALLKATSAVRDQQTRTGFEASIRNAEAIGAATSAAAASGISGGNLGMLASVQEMAVGRANEYRKVDNHRAMDNQLSQLSSVMGDAIRSLDNSPIVAQQDYTRSHSGSMMSYLMQGVMGKANSLHTLLGSLAPTPEQPMPGLTAAPKASTITQGVNLSLPVGTPIPPGPNTGRAWEHRVTPTALPPLSPSIRIN